MGFVLPLSETLKSHVTAIKYSVPKNEIHKSVLTHPHPDKKTRFELLGFGPRAGAQTTLNVFHAHLVAIMVIWSAARLCCS